jgi:hypothetical protein
MKLYHYSKDRYSILMTRAKSGKCTKSELAEAIRISKEYSRVGSYNDHISFFFDPIPLDTVAKIFKGKNDFWIKDNEIFEYVIDTKSLDKNILFEVVETPNDIKTLDATDWIDTDEFLIEYLAKKSEMKKHLGETGTGISNLDKQILKYSGRTDEFYNAASKRKDFEYNITKYAASVPHVMIYPKEGSIKYESVDKVIVGTSRRKILAVESLPQWRKW